TPVPPPRRTDDTNRSSVLLTHRQMGSPILLPALLGRFDTLRRFLAVADDFYGGIGHTELAQHLVGAARPPIAHPDVVLRRPALSTVAFEHDPHSGKIGEDGTEQARVFPKRCQSFERKLGAIVGEEGILQRAIYLTNALTLGFERRFRYHRFRRWID